MQIEIRNLKIASSLSQETTAYTADIYVDGIKTFAAMNQGCGGCDFYRPYPTAKVSEKEVNAWLAANRPEIAGSFDGELAHVIGEMLDKAEQEKENRRIRNAYARILSRSVAALRNGSLVTFKAPPTPANLAAIRSRHPALVVLNDADEATREKGLLAYCPDLAA